METSPLSLFLWGKLRVEFPAACEAAAWTPIYRLVMGWLCLLGQAWSSVASQPPWLLSGGRLAATWLRHAQEAVFLSLGTVSVAEREKAITFLLKPQ